MSRWAPVDPATRAAAVPMAIPHPPGRQPARPARCRRRAPAGRRRGGRALLSLDAHAPVPVVQIALLRSIPLLAELPAPALEGLAAALIPAEVPAGAILIRQATMPMLLRGRRGTARYLPERTIGAAVRAWRGSRGDRPPAGCPPHRNRHRPHRRCGVQARHGTIPDRGPRPCRHPAPSAASPRRGWPPTPHEAATAQQRAPRGAPRRLTTTAAGHKDSRPAIARPADRCGWWLRDDDQL